MVLVATIALGSSTFAWFVNNSSVKAEMTSVSAAASTANLLIEESTTANEKKTEGGSALATQNIGSTVALYPASLSANTVTGNGEWYVVNSWNADVQANGYNAPTITKPASGTGAGSYTLGNGQTANAYAVATYTLYTTTGSVDVYLDNAAAEKAIAVTNTVTDSDGKTAMQALRVGIVVDGTLKLVYSPYAEAAASGNDAAYEAAGSKTYKAVKNATTAGDAPYVVLAGTNGVLGTGALVGNDGKTYSATKNTDGTFSAPSGEGVTAMKLGTANTTGILVEIYVWLEGTDTECLTDAIAGDDDIYKITVNFAGVAA